MSKKIYLDQCPWAGQPRQAQMVAEEIGECVAGYPPPIINR